MERKSASFACSSQANSETERKRHIQNGIAEGLADIDAVQFEEMTDTTTADRITQFKARLPH